MTDMRPIKTSKRVADQYVSHKRPESSQSAIDTAKLGLKHQKLDASTLPDDSARAERFKELACTAILMEANREELNPSEIVPGIGGERHIILKQYNTAQANFDNFFKKRRICDFVKEEQDYCVSEYQNLNKIHQDCMNRIAEVNSYDQVQGKGMVTKPVDQAKVDQAEKELNKAFADLKQAVEKFEALRERVEKSI